MFLEDYHIDETLQKGCDCMEFEEDDDIQKLYLRSNQLYVIICLSSII